mgnify:CR=1 FL=1
MILTKHKGFREIENLCLQCGSEAIFFTESEQFVRHYYDMYKLNGSTAERHTSALTNAVI